MPGAARIQLPARPASMSFRKSIHPDRVEKRDPCIHERGNVWARNVVDTEPGTYIPVADSASGTATGARGAGAVGVLEFSSGIRDHSGRRGSEGRNVTPPLEARALATPSEEGRGSPRQVMGAVKAAEAISAAGELPGTTRIPRPSQDIIQFAALN